MDNIGDTEKNSREKVGRIDKVDEQSETDEFLEEEYSVSLDVLIKHLRLSEIYIPEGKTSRDILITRRDVNRPGLALTGFFGGFEEERIQIIGNAEHKYLTSLSDEERVKSIEAFFSRKPVCTVITRNLHVFEDSIRCAKENNVPILATSEQTSAFMAALISKLNLELAPRMTRHGVFVEIYGEGVLIIGESGIGKSETAIELVKRGHRLIADDAVEIKKVSSITLLGSAPEIIRHYIELRGVGIIDIRRLFGMGAVKVTERVDLIIKLQEWVQDMQYERLGLDNNYTEIMGIKIPSLTVPIKPGRNLAIILEVAAMNNKQKKMGYDTAAEFGKKLMGQMTEE
ncbi:MAG: HPr(Ser) kinase/phosphatase [Oscillospiraceae bacterium]|nr:HPr(Ser) kinase/phosphatase [Oscillospiraceae bacterium]